MQGVSAVVRARRSVVNVALIGAGITVAGRGTVAIVALCSRRVRRPDQEPSSRECSGKAEDDPVHVESPLVDKFDREQGYVETENGSVIRVT